MHHLFPRVPIYWDDASLPKVLVMRPASSEGAYDWGWSGGFDIPDFEMYFGLRLRHVDGQHFLNIPVNVSVNNCGAVLLTFKAQKSLAPYRITNACKDLDIHIVQVSVP